MNQKNRSQWHGGGLFFCSLNFQCFFLSASSAASFVNYHGLFFLFFTCGFGLSKQTPCAREPWVCVCMLVIIGAISISFQYWIPWPSTAIRSETPVVTWQCPSVGSKMGVTDKKNSRRASVQCSFDKARHPNEWMNEWMKNDPPGVIVFI